MFTVNFIVVNKARNIVEIKWSFLLTLASKIFASYFYLFVLLTLLTLTRVILIQSNKLYIHPSYGVTVSTALPPVVCVWELHAPTETE
jgi:hypothetical protein